MFGHKHHRRRRRPGPLTTASIAGVAVALVATTAPAPALADTPVSVSSVRWDGLPVSLVEANALDIKDGEAWTLVGKAVEFLSIDPALVCLTGRDLNVYSGVSTRSLYFSTVGDPSACVDVTFEPYINPPTLPPVPSVPGDPAPDLVCLTADCINDQAMFRAGQVTQAAFYNAGAAVERVNSAPTEAMGHGNAALAGSIPEAMAGTLVSQVESLTELYAMTFSASLTNLDAAMRLDVAGQQVYVASPLRIDPSNALGCLEDGCPVVSYSINGSGTGVGSTGSAVDAVAKAGQDPSIDPAKFVYWSGTTPTWENKDSKKGLYGAVIYNMWRLSRRVSNTNDFYATTQTASVTPEDKSRLTKVESKFEASGDGFRLVEASPLSVQQGGEGETITYSATLQGNVSAKKDGTGGEIGGSFGVARQYTRPVDNHGGGMNGPLGHYVHWSTGDNGSGYAKEAAGVETWTLPIDNAAKFLWWAKAWWCNDPCGW